MNLKEKINTDYIKYLKSKDIVAKNLLSVVKGEVQTLEKNIGVIDLPDVEIVKILLKISKGLKETILSDTNNPTYKYELSLIEGYLPKLMSKEEIIQKIQTLMSSGITDIGGIMREFSSLSADKKVVSDLIKNMK